MALEPGIKADLISVRDLHKAVDDAVRIASAKVGVDTGGNPVIVKWELMGKRIRDLKNALPFADAVTEHINASGIKAESAVLINKKIIIAGFYERINVPQIREF